VQTLKKQAAELLQQIKTTKEAGMLGKAAEAEKAVDMSARLLVGMLAKLEALEAANNANES